MKATIKRKINVSICKTKESFQKAALNCDEWSNVGDELSVEHGLPVAPKTLPLGNSHMPASSWASPPQKTAIPTTTFGVVMPRAWTLYNDNMKVVEAKENSPLWISFSWTKTGNVQGELTGEKGWRFWKVGLRPFRDRYDEPLFWWRFRRSVLSVTWTLETKGRKERKWEILKLSGLLNWLLTWQISYQSYTF